MAENIRSRDCVLTLWNDQVSTIAAENSFSVLQNIWEWYKSADYAAL